MIIWLASYPRSGNSLLRVMLKEVFGFETLSKYSGSYESASPGVAETLAFLGERPLGMPWIEAMPRLKGDKAVHLVKTHEPPESDDPCIYIVRDPISAVMSYWRYLSDFHGLVLPLEAVAAGFCIYGSWAEHVRAWNPLGRKRTLLLRYETLVNEPDAAIRSLGGFLSSEPIGAWNGDIARFRQVNPHIFRRGSDLSNREEMSPAVRRLCSALSHVEMKEFGYPIEAFGADEAASLCGLVDVARKELEHWRRIAEERRGVIADLEVACRERLAAIESLDAECKRLRGGPGRHEVNEGLHAG